MQSFFLFLKGFLIGIGKIIPGISGAVLAILLGVYDEALQKLNTFFQDKKRNFSYLFFLGLGVCLAIFLGSKFVLYFINAYFLYTMAFFGGLILGTLDTVKKEVVFTLKNSLFLLLSFFLVVSFYNEVRFTTFSFTPSFSSYFYVFFLGLVDAFCMVLPGVSATSTFISLGSYTYVLTLLSSPFSKVSEFCTFLLGTVIGVFLMVKLVSFCFKHYKKETWWVIFLFLLTSLYFFYLKLLPCLSSTNILAVFLLTLIGYEIASLFKEK